jgi:hypothetical protein
MHFVVAWEIKSEGARWQEIDNAMKEGLTGYSWVRPLRTLYVVSVKTQDSWDSFQKNLLNIAKKFLPNEVYFIMTPLMVGGSYNGYLPEDAWAKISIRTKEPGE